MMSYTATSLDFAEKVRDLCSDISDWSQATFGTDTERGPVGPLKHLKKECDEAIANPRDRTEYADLLILILDASRRAGIKPMQLVELAQEKMKLNRARTWPAPTSPDEPIEHVRDGIAGTDSLP